MNKDMCESLPNPPLEFLISPKPGNQGENLYNEDQVLDEDSLQEAIKKIKDQAKQNGESDKIRKQPKDLSEFRPEQLKEAYDAFQSSEDSDSEESKEDENDGDEWNDVEQSRQEKRT